MLCYHDAIVDDGITYSIDNVVLDVWVSSPENRDIIEARINCLYDSNVNIVEWESNKPGTFQQQYSFKLNDGTSFWLGHGLVCSGVMVERYRLEFNPNKVGGNSTFKEVHELLIKNSRKPLNRITRFDLAVDIPEDRVKCFLVKDRRLYIERKHGVEFTQYLGSKSSAVGRVKLYNKSVQAKLDYPLTRLELTLNPATPYEDVNFPLVYRINTERVAEVGMKITETERFIINALLQGYGALNELGRKTRVKIETLLKGHVDRILVTPEMYDKVLEKLSGYLKDDTGS